MGVSGRRSVHTLVISWYPALSTHTPQALLQPPVPLNMKQTKPPELLAENRLLTKGSWSGP
jgi:hypothetical protein